MELSNKKEIKLLLKDINVEINSKFLRLFLLLFLDKKIK